MVSAQEDTTCVNVLGDGEVAHGAKDVAHGAKRQVPTRVLMIVSTHSVPITARARSSIVYARRHCAAVSASCA